MRDTIEGLERWRRQLRGFPTSLPGDLFGLFAKRYRGADLTIISSGPATTWEHVSVSGPERTPTWEEMSHVRRIFWHDDELVMQYHPRAWAFVNEHPHCLHLWRYRGFIPTPPAAYVGNVEPDANPTTPTTVREALRQAAKAFAPLLIESAAGASYNEFVRVGELLELAEGLTHAEPRTGRSLLEDAAKHADLFTRDDFDRMLADVQGGDEGDR